MKKIYCMCASGTNEEDLLYGCEWHERRRFTVWVRVARMKKIYCLCASGTNEEDLLYGWVQVARMKKIYCMGASGTNEEDLLYGCEWHGCRRFTVWVRVAQMKKIYCLGASGEWHKENNGSNLPIMITNVMHVGGWGQGWEFAHSAQIKLTTVSDSLRTLKTN